MTRNHVYQQFNIVLFQCSILLNAIIISSYSLVSVQQIWAWEGFISHTHGVAWQYSIPWTLLFFACCSFFLWAFDFSRWSRWNIVHNSLQLPLENRQYIKESSLVIIPLDGQIWLDIGMENGWVNHNLYLL